MSHSLLHPLLLIGRNGYRRILRIPRLTYTTTSRNVLRFGRPHDMPSPVLLHRVKVSVRCFCSWRLPKNVLDPLSGTARPPTTDAAISSDKEHSTPQRFEDLKNLHPNSKRALQLLGLEKMTEIQAKTWEKCLAGNDMVGRARTGTGKTLAFLLPTLERVIRKPRSNVEVSILVLSPARELAQQIGRQAQAITNQFDQTVTSQVVIGGFPVRQDHAKFLKAGNFVAPTILVATPGRLLAHLRRTNLHSTPFSHLFQKLQVLVVDETDLLLGTADFRDQIGEILTYLPPTALRQTILFSATLPPAIHDLIRKSLKPNYEWVDCIGESDEQSTSATATGVKQSVVVIQKSRLFSAPVEIITDLLENEHRWRGRPPKIIAFFPTAALVSLYSFLFNNRLGRRVYDMHSNKEQEDRSMTSDQFHNAKSAVLLTTDASARGMDYKGTTHSLQFGMAENRDMYIHRAGRTARAGEEGESLLVLTPEEDLFLHRTLSRLPIRPNLYFEGLLSVPINNDLDFELSEILANIRDGTDPELAALVMAAHQSLVRFYMTRRSELDGDNAHAAASQMANAFLRQGGIKTLPRVVSTVGFDGPWWNVGEKFDVGRPPESRGQSSNDNTGSTSDQIFGRWRQPDPEDSEDDHSSHKKPDPSK